MEKKMRAFVLLLLGSVLITGWNLPQNAFAAVPKVNELVSVDSSGTASNGYSGRPSVSCDGNIVAYESDATNLVNGDMNGHQDIFVRNRSAGTTTLVSVSSSGIQANYDSGFPEVSCDGRYVVFATGADNIVSGVPSGTTWHIYMHDLQTGATTIVDTSSAGVVANNTPSGWSDISADGRFVVFNSYASNLVSGVDPMGGMVTTQLFVKDTQTGAIRHLSKNANGVKANGDITNHPHISCDGSIVTFTSTATNLVPGDTNGKTDVFVDQLGLNGSDSLTNITAGANNDSVEAEVSCDGNNVAYVSYATNIVSGVNPIANVYKYDRLSAVNTLISQSTDGVPGMGDNQWVTISEDGRYVAFLSSAIYPETGVVYDGVRDFVYVRDSRSQTTQIVPYNLYGHATGDNQSPFMSPDGSYVAYRAASDGATDPNRALVSGDANNKVDVVISRTGAVGNSTGSPSNLTAISPAINPTLQWDAVAEASSYNVYRDGVKLDSTTDTSYSDTTATEGTHSYYVTAVGADMESEPSNAVTVVVDRTAPAVSITSLTPGQKVSGVVTISANITEANATSYSLEILNHLGNVVESYVVQNPVGSTFVYEWDTTDVKNQTYAIVISATDALGNTSPASSQTIEIKVK